MPTLHTVLAARHKPGVPKQPQPPTEGPRRKSTRSLLQSEGALESIGRAPAGRRRLAARTARRVIVVGAGFAGLCAAYELAGLGYEVRVFEARDRVGGRVHSLKGLIPGKVLEGGGELIGSNHHLWLRYRRHLGLRFSAVKDYKNSPIRIGSQTLTFEQSARLNHHLDVVLAQINRAARRIRHPFEPWRARNAAALDRRSLASWLRKRRGTRRARRAVAEMLAADNGVPAHSQSLLGVLAMVKGGGLERYWTDSELYRCVGGNQQLAESFRTELNRTRHRVFTKCPVTAIERSGATARVTVRFRGKRRVYEAEDVVLAIPPSVWKKIDFSDPRLRRRLRNPPQMGSNTKYLMRLRRRFWRDFASSPTFTEDGPVDITWETTEEDKNGDFGWVGFSGADDASRLVQLTRRARRRRLIAALRIPYPGLEHQMRADRFMNWPRTEWTDASYHFPKMNEVTCWGPFWKSGHDGWLHFAGEHTCFAFVGYMEGALQSGYRLARRLAKRDKSRLRNSLRK